MRITLYHVKYDNYVYKINYIFSEEGLNLIVKAINDHSKDDEILFVSLSIFNLL